MNSSVSLNGEFQNLLKEIKKLQNEQKELLTKLKTNICITEQLLMALLDRTHEGSLSNGDILNLRILKESSPDITVCTKLLHVLQQLRDRYNELLRLTENVFLNSARIVNTAFLVRIFLACQGTPTLGKIKFILKREMEGLHAHEIESQNVKRYIGVPSLHVRTNIIKQIANKLLITLKMDLNGKYDDLNLIRVRDAIRDDEKEERLDYLFKSKKKKRFGRKKRVKNREEMLKKIEENKTSWLS
ncbi:hypothetical protein THOM_2469 [Trachipleistophora hominis]|uniref:Uncharacterized protein n=1 Tax=Trachipleistophora hominis TaxID=72359 RepID=L7JU31_TRAHO|nr:hypothetical protein THOM_2469 [Trachipleistophora hominis]